MEIIDNRVKEVQDKKKSSWGKIVLVVVLIGIILLAARVFDVHILLSKALSYINDLGIWGVFFFILLYIFATVFFLPGSVLTLGSGVLFGLFKGTLVVSVASILGASCAFLVGRYLARGWVSKKIEGNEKFKAIDEAVAKEGWKIVGLTRLSPVFPFNLLNYAFGLTKVSFRDYFFASWVGMIPGTVMYVYIGSLAGSLSGVGESGGSRSAAENVLFVVGLLATVAVTVLITRIAKKALEKKIS